jgi:hypothetical protein
MECGVGAERYSSLSITHQQMYEVCYILLKISLKSFTLKHSHNSYMFRHIVCHPQGYIHIFTNP